MFKKYWNASINNPKTKLVSVGLCCTNLFKIFSSKKASDLLASAIVEWTWTGECQIPRWQSFLLRTDGIVSRGASLPGNNNFVRHATFTCQSPDTALLVTTTHNFSYYCGMKCKDTTIALHKVAQPMAPAWEVEDLTPKDLVNCAKFIKNIMLVCNLFYILK